MRWVFRLRKSSGRLSAVTSSTLQSTSDYFDYDSEFLVARQAIAGRILLPKKSKE
jgi:hypothetical protein